MARLGDDNGATTEVTSAELERVLDRLRASVLRPLQQAVEELAHGADVSLAARSETEPAAETTDAVSRPQLDATIWGLATDVTELAQQEGSPAVVGEAVAALQDLACGGRTLRLGLRPGSASSPVCHATEARSGGHRLAERTVPRQQRGGRRLARGAGSTAPTVALCRCGGSSTKPWCDGSHATNGFSDAKDAKRIADHLGTYVGQQLTVTDNRGTCAHSGFCTDRLPVAFRAGTEPFVAPSGARMDEIVRAVRACPSGALGMRLLEKTEANQADQTREPVIEISKNGPYRIRGAVSLKDGAGLDVPQNAGASREHYSLCRCGHSLNKPFCSGMHWYVNFEDPLPSVQPNLFEWAGGLPALTRLTRLFYERHVPEDPLLASLFASMPIDQPDRLAAWLAEAFGGPTLYSRQFGGHAQMLSRHAGMALSEDQRARWVSTLIRCADELPLPADPEFRSAFAACLEWGSRTVMAASTVGAPVAADSPLPQWTRGPGGQPRVEPVATTTDELASPLPDPGAVVTFDEHIGLLFRARDRDAMKFAFDLSSYADVAQNAAAILAKVRSGAMPCDEPWPPERVALFERWVVGGLRQAAGGDPGADSRAAEASQPAPEGTSARLPIEAIEGRLGRAVALRSTKPVEEPTLVLEHREPLIYMLCAAAELEHALMCEYLFAAFSLKRSVDEGLTNDQLDAVERWRSTILLVAKQEMLHLAINCNLVSSLGASPHLSRPNLPQPAKHYPSGVRLALLPFGEQALRHFLFLERPEGMDIDDADGLAAVDCAVPVMGERRDRTRTSRSSQTVGHLYRSIEAGFRHLSEQVWARTACSSVRPDAQAHGDLFGWPQLRPITTCDAAVQSIEAIVEQGEGPRGDWRNAHFGRFLGVLNEYLDMLEANPGSGGRPARAAGAGATPRERRARRPDHRPGDGRSPTSATSPTRCCSSCSIG